MFFDEETSEEMSCIELGQILGNLAFCKNNRELLFPLIASCREVGIAGIPIKSSGK